MYFFFHTCRRIIELKEKAGEKDEIGVAAAMNNLAVFHCLKVFLSCIYNVIFLFINLCHVL